MSDVRRNKVPCVIVLKSLDYDLRFVSCSFLVWNSDVHHVRCVLAAERISDMLAHLGQVFQKTLVGAPNTGC